MLLRGLNGGLIIGCWVENEFKRDKMEVWWRFRWVLYILGWGVMVVWIKVLIVKMKRVGDRFRISFGGWSYMIYNGLDVEGWGIKEDSWV